MKTLHCSDVEIIEWYDGLIQGFVYCADNLFYAILLAFDADERERLYLIIPLGAAEREVISAAYSESGEWLVARKLIEAIVAQRECYFSCDIPGKNADLQVSTVPDSAKSDFRFGQWAIYLATGREARKRWLGSGGL